MPSPATLAFAVTRLSSFDLGIVAVYLLGITLFGLSFRKRNAGKSADKSLKSYFLADNTIPWWAIALSIVSAETSTLTIISIPGVAFAGDFGFLQVVLGYMLGRIVVAGLFLPRYFAGEMLTAYQLIDRRFGPTLHKVTAGLFLLTRSAAEGVRVFAVSIVVGLAIGTSDVLSIGIISLLTLLYTFEGGMAAVVWTDVVQMAIYVGGTVVALFTLGSHVQGGWHYILSLGQDAGKFHMFNFALNLTTTYTFWAGVLGGTFLTMASHGTDQLMVQRLLAARNLRESRLALLSSGVVIFIQFALFLLIGVGLWVFYGAGLHTSAAGIKGLSPDHIFPTFIVQEMPLGIAGLLVAAILAAAMSNLSAALNSLSSTTVVDFYMRLRPDADDRERTMISKSSTAVWALVLFAIAVYSVHTGGKGHVVETGLSIASVAYGCLLGVFLLGTLTRFATQWGAIAGMIVGFAVNLALWQFPGRSAMHIAIPTIAWTWYVLIGAFVTFAVGSLASLLLRSKPARSSALALVPFMLVLLSGACHAQAEEPQPRNTAQNASDTPDFSQVSQILNDAIAAHKLPGAVVLIGHGGKVVFEHAYGDRKLAGEPGLDGKPSPAEAMTEDTIFDMASLSKCLATATAIMQLYEAGKLQFDDPVEKYLPEFNATHDPTRSKVTLRMLLTHFSGEAPDVDLKDPWGLAKPDKAEGMRRALTTPLKNAPGAHFEYSDINFILLGDIVEKISGEPEDVYAQEHIFAPLGMTETRYLPVDKACGPHKLIGAAIAWAPKPPGNVLIACPKGDWSTSLLSRIAPTTHDDESKADPAANPHYDMLTRGTVHDPTTRRMGDVAGHAGVFSTAHDMSLFAQAMLDKLVGNTGPFPLKQATLRLMTSPEQPGHGDDDLDRANAAQYGFPSSIASFHVTNPSYPAVKDHTLRGFGWDIDSAFSKPRGAGFLIGSFGHTGFTGTSLWIDPYSDTYVVLLANAIHPRGNPPISNLRGDVATAAAKVLVHYPPAPGKSAENCVPSDLPPYACEAPANPAEPSKPHMQNIALTMKERRDMVEAELDPGYSGGWAANLVSTGIDVLESTQAKVLVDLAAAHGNHLTLGLLTNQAGLDSNGKRTIDYLHSLTSDNMELTALFSPEHGIFGKQDSTNISAETDPATGLHVTSLYGPHDADKRPSHEQLAKLDAVVIDLQDVGVHYWTYESVLGYFLEAAAKEQTEFHHHFDIVVLDRPNPIGGLATQGPLVDADRTSYVAYMPLPVRHGLTYGELARYIVMAKHLDAPLTVVAMQGWSRKMLWSDTGLPWTNPSPNLRSPEAALLYPALGLIETTNISVGRGTEHPFSFFGAGVAAPAKPSTGTGPDLKTSLTLPNANNSSTTVVSAQLTPNTSPIVPTANTATVGVPLGGKAQSPQHIWFHADEVAMELNARHIRGVAFAPVRETIAEDANHYPFHGQTIEAVRVRLTDPSVADTPEIGIEILAALHRLYPTQFNLEKSMTLVANRATVDAIARGDDPRTIAASWQPSLDAFRTATQPLLLYR